MELEGVEPSSKQGDHMLSTCLALPSVFVHRQDQSHPLVPYPLRFRRKREANFRLFPNLLCRFVKRFGTRAFERHPVPGTMPEIKVIYFASITQREHNFRCQINFDNGDYRALLSTLCMLTYHLNSLSKPNKPNGYDKGTNIYGLSYLFSI